jgi:hypothetical protein
LRSCCCGGDGRERGRATGRQGCRQSQASKRHRFGESLGLVGLVGVKSDQCADHARGEAVGEITTQIEWASVGDLVEDVLEQSDGDGVEPSDLRRGHLAGQDPAGRSVERGVVRDDHPGQQLVQALRAGLQQEITRAADPVVRAGASRTTGGVDLSRRDAAPLTSVRVFGPASS